MTYYRLAALQEQGIGNVDKLPFSIKVLLESLLRNENGYDVTDEDVRGLAAYDAASPAEVEIPFKPARVILQRLYRRPGSCRFSGPQKRDGADGRRPAGHQPAYPRRSGHRPQRSGR